ncbi:MAG: hypothetical protein AAGD25_11270 [Cyanobacteria bacterium P01_F01_bin.150]
MMTGLNYRIAHNPDSSHFMTESVAFGQYWPVHEELELDCAVCLNMGPQTTDIGIWCQEQLIHQCSINFTGRDLFTNVLRLKPASIARYFERNPNEWQNLSGDDFSWKLAVLLRWESRTWLRKKRPSLKENKDFQGLIRIIALGFSGLHYYLGLAMQSLATHGLYSKDDLPSIYLGGGDMGRVGSPRLHWLDEAGQFYPHTEINWLFSHLLSSAAGLPVTQTYTHLSTSPQHEIAYGLISPKPLLNPIAPHDSPLFVAGEAYQINFTPCAWNHPILTHRAYSPI